MTTASDPFRVFECGGCGAQGDETDMYVSGKCPACGQSVSMRELADLHGDMHTDSNGNPIPAAELPLKVQLAEERKAEQGRANKRAELLTKLAEIEAETLRINAELNRLDAEEADYVINRKDGYPVPPVCTAAWTEDDWADWARAGRIYETHREDRS